MRGYEYTLPNLATSVLSEAGLKLASLKTIHVWEIAAVTVLRFWATRNRLNRIREDTNESDTSLLPHPYAWLVTLARHVLATLPNNCRAVNCIRPLSLRASAELNFLVPTVLSMNSPSSSFLASVLSMRTLLWCINDTSMFTPSALHIASLCSTILV